MPRTGFLIAAVLVSLAAPAAAGARPDSAAPPGATNDWLPQEAWVMERRLPYDEAHLQRVLRVTPAQLRGWLRTTRRNLLGLARERGVPTTGLAERLVSRRPAATYAVRLARARRTLTQSHLLLHVLRHDFHQWSILRATPRAFGVDDVDQWRRMRLRGMTPLEIAARSGRDAAAARAVVVKVLERSAARGVGAGETSAAQADRFLTTQLRTLDRWLRSPLVRPATEPDPARAAALICHL